MLTPGGSIAAIVFSVLTSDMCRFDLIDEPQTSGSLIVQPDDAPAIAAVPQTVVLLAPVRRLIIDQEHLCFSAKDLRFHNRVPVFLPHMPADQLLLLLMTVCSPAKTPPS